MKRHILIQELMGLLDIHEDVYRIVDLFIQKLFDVYKAETDLVTRYRLLHHVRAALMLRREEVPANKRMPQLCMALTELIDAELNLLLSHRDLWKSSPIAKVRWTADKIDLVELLYALHEVKCIDNGDMTLKEMEMWMYRLFGTESKDCYRFYVSIRNRKRDSRTAFLDHLKDKLLEKMQRDDRREMQRK